MADTKTLGTEVRRQLVALLDGGQAHATLDDAVKGFPAALQGVVPEGLPYSGWQILEHLRITQQDILSFSDNAGGEGYKELKWPKEYWPREAAPASEAAWEECVAAIKSDRKAFDKLVDEASDEELVTPFAWGSGQNLLREALLIADHNAYHLGEIVVVRRLLGAWK